MTLLPSESQQPDERLSLVWTMVYALAAAFAFAFFNDDVVGRWYPELNAGAQVPRPRESVRRPLALFLYVFVGLYFFSARKKATISLSRAQSSLLKLPRREMGERNSTH